MLHHGANRLGTNSLGDLIVFDGARHYAAKYAAAASFVKFERPQDYARNLLDRALSGSAKEACRTSARVAGHDAGQRFGLRTDETLCEQINIIRDLKARYREIGVEDQGEQYNTELMEALNSAFTRQR
ncbi:MAG: hypothetical protein WKH64_17505 [Chloroflexia bacterium]